MVVPRERFFSAFARLKEYHDLMLRTLEEAKHSHALDEELLQELQTQVDNVTEIVVAFKRCADTSSLQKRSSKLH